MTRLWTRADARFLSLALAAWTVIAAIVWVAARSLPGNDASARLIAWTLGLASLASLGTLIERRIAQHVHPSDASLPVLDGALLWALASAVGWGIDVRVGGPLSGLATARLLAPVADLPGSLRWRCAGIAAALAGGAAVLLGGAGDPGRALRGFVGVLLGGLVGLAGTPALGRAAALVPVWAVAWVGAYYLAGRLSLPDLGGYGGTGAEVVLAFFAGGIGTSLIVRGRRLAWAFALAGLAAATLAVLGDFALRFVRVALAGPGGWARSHLSITQTMAMGLVAAIVAVWSRRARGSARTEAVDGAKKLEDNPGRPA